MTESSNDTLTAEEKQKLYCQIIAFKYLSRELPIPDKIKTFLNDDNDNIESIIPSILTPTAEGIIQTTMAMKKQNSLSNYHTLPSSASSGSLLQHVQLFPDQIVFTGLDPLTLAHEREKVINARVSHRIQELERWIYPFHDGSVKVSLSSEISDKKAVDNEESNEDVIKQESIDDEKLSIQTFISEGNKLRLFTELKKLRLLTKQKQVKISYSMFY